jgi:hypothetical protein
VGQRQLGGDLLAHEGELDRAPAGRTQDGARLVVAAEHQASPDGTRPARTFSAATRPSSAATRNTRAVPPAPISATIARNTARYGAGLYLYRADTNLTRCVVEDNVATWEDGGFDVYDSVVVDTHGVVRRNVALAGGGLFLNNDNATVLELIDSDWATGMADENVPDDVGCASDTIGWLGVGVTVTCTVVNGTCACL